MHRHDRHVCRLVAIGNRAPKCMNGLINIWLRSDAVSCADYLRVFREQMEEKYKLRAYWQRAASMLGLWGNMNWPPQFKSDKVGKLSE